VADRLGMRLAETFELPGGSERGRRYELAL
ncbi:GNAT family N-acetyltransferase, partial [Streptomyces sp. SID11233]|nr:GNAT family N-acetyltransferase [Streptomyces sp. SID11233]